MPNRAFEIESLYVGDYNCFDPEGEASWVDMTLLQIIKEQQERIEQLALKLEAHIDRQAAYEFEGV